MNTLSEQIFRLLKAALRKMGKQHDEAKDATACDIEVVNKVLQNEHEVRKKAIETMTDDGYRF